jgi:hypothetical protein
MRHDEIAAAAHHEAAHAVSTVLAFRDAVWLPMPPPRLPVRYCEITSRGGGTCQSSDIYCAAWPIDCLKPRYRPLMEAQVCIELSGGVAEAIFHGVRGRHDVVDHMETNLSIDADLDRAAPVLRDLFRVTCYRFEPRDFVGPTLEMLEAHWPAVTALANALVDERRIEGRRVERIIDRSPTCLPERQKRLRAC